MQEQPQQSPIPPQIPGGQQPNDQQNPPTKNRLWIWITLGVVSAILVIGGVVLAVILANQKPASDSSQDTSVSKSEKSDSKKDQSDDSDKQPTKTVNSKCLVAKDLRDAGFSEIKDDVFRISDSKYSLDNVFFLADSTDYEFESVTIERLGYVLNLYKNNNKKEFSFLIIGSTREDVQSAGGIELANQRAGKIKDYFVSQGMPAEKIEIGTPVASNNGEVSRNALIYLVVDQSCS